MWIYVLQQYQISIISKYCNDWLECWIQFKSIVVIRPLPKIEWWWTSASEFDNKIDVDLDLKCISNKSRVKKFTSWWITQVNSILNRNRCVRLWPELVFFPKNLLVLHHQHILNQKILKLVPTQVSWTSDGKIDHSIPTSSSVTYKSRDI